MKRTLQAVLASGFALAATSVHAGAYKCTDATGKVSYQQQPCPQSSKAQALASTSSTISGWQSWRIDPFANGQKEYFIHSEVRTVGKLRRAAFRFNITDPENPNLNSMSGVMYHYYDCAAGAVSAGIPEDLRAQLEPTMADATVWPYARAASQGIEVTDPKTVAKVCGG